MFSKHLYTFASTYKTPMMFVFVFMKTKLFFKIFLALKNFFLVLQPFIFTEKLFILQPFWLHKNIDFVSFYTYSFSQFFFPFDFIFISTYTNFIFKVSVVFYHFIFESFKTPIFNNFPIFDVYFKMINIP